jgi:hypothetical protein
MGEFLNNGIVQSVLGALIVAGLFTVYRNRVFRKDENRIVEFLKQSAIETGNTFRSTHAISSELDLTEERVKVVCSKSKLIKRNLKEKQSWRLFD